MGTSRNLAFRDEVQGVRSAATGTGLLGSDANFMTMQSIAPGGCAKGTMNLDSDPKNPRAPRNAAIRPKNEITIPRQSRGFSKL